jgi:hypothetical protein
MIFPKTLLAAGAVALMSTAAWALPSQASTNANGHAPSSVPVGPPSTTPVGPQDHPSNHSDGHATPGGPGEHGNSHKCKPQRVGFVVAGTLVSQTLTKNEDGTYSGELKVTVKHTNHHAAGEEVTTEKTYSLTAVHVGFGLADTNSDGSVGLDDLKPGDPVLLIGKVTKLVRKCDHTGFSPHKTIRMVVFHEATTV